MKNDNPTFPCLVSDRAFRKIISMYFYVFEHQWLVRLAVRMKVLNAVYEYLTTGTFVLEKREEIEREIFEIHRPFMDNAIRRARIAREAVARRKAKKAAETQKTLPETEETVVEPEKTEPTTPVESPETGQSPETVETAEIIETVEPAEVIESVPAEPVPAEPAIPATAKPTGGVPRRVVKVEMVRDGEDIGYRFGKYIIFH